MQKTVRLIVLAGFICGGPAAMAQSPAAANGGLGFERPQLKTGDQWVYQVRDGWTGKETSSFTLVFERQEGDRLVYQRKVATDAQPTIMRSDPDFNTCATMLNSEQEVCAKALQFPIVQGQSVSHEKYPFSNREGHSQAKCTVAAQESVTVPAGAFQAWRVECKGFWNHMSGSSGRLNITLWYSPVVFRSVRIATESFLPSGGPNNKTLTELQSFSHAAR